MVSIIVTIYNSEKYLKEALDSIVNQTYQDYEVIMVNDGSADNSGAIALSYTSDQRFKLINNEHVGFPQAKNIGLSNVHGDYVIFLDSDDIAHPQWLELLIKPILENNVDISYCDYVKFNDGEKIELTSLDASSVRIKDMSDQKMCPLFYPGCRNYMWNKLIKRELYNGIIFKDCPCMSDVQVMYKIFDKASTVFHVDSTLVYYRQREDSIIGRLCETKEFARYRFELLLKVVTFVYNKYEISRFICKRYLDNELSKVRLLAGKEECNKLYKKHKKQVDHILKEDYVCDFDVDLVIPYVDSRDPVWRKVYTDFTHRSDYVNDPRFDNPSLFEYFLRGVDKFMPWVRKIHLIVSNIEQVPAYINKEKTHIVLHKDIMPESILPTYNSSTIEMFITKIEGLSEHFIYANDDMYPIREMFKSDFFTEDGKPKIVFKTNYVKKNMTFFNTLCLNGYRHLAEVLDYPIDDTTFLRPEHTIASFVLSRCKECLSKMWHYVEQDLGPFRTTKQHTQYMYSLYERFTNGYVFGGPSFKYYDLNGRHEAIVNNLKGQGCQILCLNGVPDNAISKEHLDEIVSLLKENLGL